MRGGFAADVVGGGGGGGRLKIGFIFGATRGVARAVTGRRMGGGSDTFGGWMVVGFTVAKINRCNACYLKRFQCELKRKKVLRKHS